MKCLLVAINAKYIHSNPAVYLLKACAAKTVPSVEVELAEYTINHHAAEIFDDIYMREADIICFSCYIWNIDFVKTLVKNLKKVNPEIPIWLGGPEVSYECERQLQEMPVVDGILYGEGEQSFPKLLKHYAEHTALPDGCVYRTKEGALIRTEPSGCVPMDEIPFVYEDVEGFENRIIYYESSRGCPFSCSYCLSSIDKRMRFRSLELVKKELAFFLEKKVPQVKFVDRTFNSKKTHAMEIWRFLKEHDNGVTNFHFEIAADLLDEEELALIAAMRPGLIQLEIGIQSANLDTIQAIRRKMNLSRVAEITEQIRKQNNVHQHLDLIAGLPWEDYESFGHSFDAVYRMQPSELQLGFLKVLKGSPMYYEAASYGILYQEEAPYEVLQTKWLSHKEIIRLKYIEDMVEVYYNSGQFLYTIKWLETLFTRPFLLYEALGEAAARDKLREKKHVREARYQYLISFVKELQKEKQIWDTEEAFSEALSYLQQSLTLDYYLREYAKKRPAFAIPDESWKDELRAFSHKQFPTKAYKDVLKQYHMEIFTPPFTKKRQYWLFQYDDRDPLHGNAAVKKFDADLVVTDQ